MKQQILRTGLLALLFFGTVALITPEEKITVWLAGDSTVCDQPLDRSPVTGWGTPFASFFDSTVVVKNHAKGGRSTRTFISEGRWETIKKEMKAGDYVFIQFGHNDEAKEPQYKDRYTPVPDYKKNLALMIADTRAHNATPVLVKPVSRMRFSNDGTALETHTDYTAAVWEIGKQYKVPVIDLDAHSRKLLQQLGPEPSKMLFMYLDSMQHPHYPNGKKDGTHFNEYGARRMAELVLAEIRKQQLPLVARVTTKAAP